MITREELKAEMKKDAGAVWSKVKDAVRKYGAYGLLGAAFTAGYIGKSDTPAPKTSAYDNSLAAGSQRLDNRLKLNDMKSAKAKGTINWEEALKPQLPLWLPQDADKQAEEMWEKAMNGKVAGNLSVDELMANAGVTPADIQAVVNKNPEIISRFEPGNTGKSLARAADGVVGKPEGNCLGGVQTMIGVANIGVTIEKDNPDWPQKERYAGNSNSACNTYIPLEKSGQFLTINVKNKAYTRGNSEHKQEENRAMKEFNRKLPAGTIACVDNKKADAVRGFRPQNAGEIHGHTWVLDNDKRSKCDGEQPDGPDFTRYGPVIHISMPKDGGVPKDVALEFIKQAQKRQQAQQQLQVKTATRN